MKFLLANVSQTLGTYKNPIVFIGRKEFPNSDKSRVRGKENYSLHLIETVFLF